MRQDSSTTMKIVLLNMVNWKNNHLPLHTALCLAARHSVNSGSVEPTSVMASNNSTPSLSCNHSEEYKFTTYTVVFSLIFVFGLVGNVGALYVFCKFSIKNRLSTIFLIHLAASDLVFILTLPIRIAFYSTYSPSSAGMPRSFTMTALDFTCRFSTYLFYISMYCSILFLTALSLCRYLVLAGRVRLQNSEACRWARILCWGIWVFVLGGNMLYIAATFGFNIKAEGCLEPRGESWGWLYQLNLIVLVICFLLPLTVVLICYSLMIRHILRTRAGQRQRDVALVCLVLCIFCLCFLPYHIQRTLHLYYTMHHQKDCQLLATLQKTVVRDIGSSSIHKLQMVQNSAARLLTHTHAHHHITPVLQRLHWLPLKHRIQFKILLLTYKALNNLTPCTCLIFFFPINPLALSGRLRLDYFPSLHLTSKALVTEPSQDLPLDSGTLFHYWSNNPIHLPYSNLT
ncbi:hypothetical protein AOLI_G00219280 [Acnodon oligacanthus]